MEGEGEGPQMDKDLHALALFRWSVVPSSLLHRDKRGERDQTWIERRKEKRQRRGKHRLHSRTPTPAIRAADQDLRDLE